MKGVVFDMDGVLVDSMAFHIYSWCEAFKKSNLVVSDEELSLFEGMPYRETVDYVSKKNNVSLSESEKKLIYTIKKDILDSVFELKTYLGIVDFVSLLKKQGFKLAVVTGSNREFADKVVSSFFGGSFDFVITSDDVIKGKPNPEPYLKAINLIGLEKKDLVVIENAPLGIKSAKDAGLKVIALETTLDKMHLGEADIVFNNHAGLFDYFSSLITPRC